MEGREGGREERIEQPQGYGSRYRAGWLVRGARGTEEARELLPYPPQLWHRAG